MDMKKGEESEKKMYFTSENGESSSFPIISGADKLDHFSKTGTLPEVISYSFIRSFSSIVSMFIFLFMYSLAIVWFSFDFLFNFFKFLFKTKTLNLIITTSTFLGLNFTEKSKTLEMIYENEQILKNFK